MLISYGKPIRPPRDKWDMLIRTKTPSLFFAISSFNEKDILKAAGFRWGPDLLFIGHGSKPGYWWTDEEAIAARLGAYCDEVAAPFVRDLVESRKESRRTDADIEIPAPPGQQYLPFQRAGIAYAMDRSNVLIGDEMGLGKTIQAIGVLNSLPAEECQRVLIICPATLKRNWKRELSRWLVHPLLVGAAEGKRWPAAHVVIANFDILGKHTEMLRQHWDVLIVDECHLVKNPSTARARAILGGETHDRDGAKVTVPPIRAGRRIFLSGTPMVNRPGELFPLLHSLDPDRWPSFSKYKFRYCDGPNGGRHLDELQDILRSTVMIRRLKADVLAELPPKRRQVLEIEPTTAEHHAVLERQREFDAKYGDFLSVIRARVAEVGQTDTELSDAFAAKGRDYIWAAFEELSELRHETALAKAPQVAEHVEDLLLSGTPKVVVFAHHLDVLHALFDKLKGYGAVILTGETPVHLRQGIVDSFQNDSRTRVFIGGMLAAGVGITLTASDTVVFGELDWVPGNLKQAEDRCHRIGAEVHESILIQHILLEGSMDVGIADIVSEKLATIEAALDRRVMPKAVPDADMPIGALGSDTRGAYTIQRQTERIAQVDRLFPGGIEQVRAIHECLKILAGHDVDRARELNGEGFSRIDVQIGHSLAEWPDDLTPKQAQTGQRIVEKYRRQLPEELFWMAIKGTEVPVNA